MKASLGMASNYYDRSAQILPDHGSVSVLSVKGNRQASPTSSTPARGRSTLGDREGGSGTRAQAEEGGAATKEQGRRLGSSWTKRSAAPPFPSLPLSSLRGSKPGSSAGIQAMQSVLRAGTRAKLEKVPSRGWGDARDCSLITRKLGASQPLQPLCSWEGHIGAHYHTIFNKSGLYCFPREIFPGPVRSYLFIRAGREAELATEQKAHFSTAWSLF